MAEKKPKKKSPVDPRLLEIEALENMARKIKTREMTPKQREQQDSLWNRIWYLRTKYNNENAMKAAIQLTALETAIEKAEKSND